MRWIVFILLLLGALFSLTVFVSAGHSRLWHPFAADAKPVIELMTGPNANLIPRVLGSVSGLFFLAAIVGLFWKALPVSWWPMLVYAAVTTSVLLCLLYFGVWILTPLFLNVILVWGVHTKRWLAVCTKPNDTTRLHP